MDKEGKGGVQGRTERPTFFLYFSARNGYNIKNARRKTMARRRNRESEEMYLEAILLLRKSSSNVHSVDVMNELGFAKSSTSRGLHLLIKKGYITMDESGVIEFTEAGKKRAEGVYERHQVLTAAIKKLGGSEELAERDGCRIEHMVSDELLELLKKFVEEE